MGKVVKFPKRPQQEIVAQCFCGGVDWQVHVKPTNGEYYIAFGFECCECGYFIEAVEEGEEDGK